MPSKPLDNVVSSPLFLLYSVGCKTATTLLQNLPALRDPYYRRDSLANRKKPHLPGQQLLSGLTPVENCSKGLSYPEEKAQ